MENETSPAADDGATKPYPTETFGTPDPAAETSVTEELGFGGHPDPAPVFSTDAVTRPPLRWGGVVWGALFAAFGVFVVATVTSSPGRTAFAIWLQGLGPSGAGVVALVVLGGLLLITGVVAAASRAQRSRTRSPR